jgi:hypothetical protein
VDVHLQREKNVRKRLIEGGATEAETHVRPWNFPDVEKLSYPLATIRYRDWPPPFSSTEKRPRARVGNGDGSAIGIG